jgi:hypothetical protein
MSSSFRAAVSGFSTQRHSPHATRRVALAALLSLAGHWWVLSGPIGDRGLSFVPVDVRALDVTLESGLPRPSAALPIDRADLPRQSAELPTDRADIPGTSGVSAERDIVSRPAVSASKREAVSATPAPDRSAAETIKPPSRATAPGAQPPDSGVRTARTKDLSRSAVAPGAQRPISGLRRAETEEAPPSGTAPGAQLPSSGVPRAETNEPFSSTIARGAHPPVRSGADAPDPNYYDARDLDVYPQLATALDLPRLSPTAEIDRGVLLRVQIDEHGAIERIDFVEADPPAKVDVVRRAFMAVRFIPARRNGRAVKSRILVRVTSRE